MRLAKLLHRLLHEKAEAMAEVGDIPVIAQKFMSVTEYTGGNPTLDTSSSRSQSAVALLIDETPQGIYKLAPSV